MKKGTQAMLDAAKDDATLLPFDTVFVTKNKRNVFDESGVKIVREKNEDYDQDDNLSVRFAPSVPHASGEEFGHFRIKDILPAKKSKPKKWQNGTQEQLDAAKDDARLIPKKTYFKSLLPEMDGVQCYVIPCEKNDSYSVMMMEWVDSSDVMSRCWFHAADDLEPIND